MSTYTVLVTEPSRANKWQHAIGTTIVPVKSPLPMNVTVTKGARLITRPMYEVDVHALTLDQQAGLIAQKATEWDCSIEEARSLVNQIGLGVQADHCQAAPPPTASRDPRKGELQIGPDDTFDRCKSCGQPIIWHKLSPGRFMPLSVTTIEQDLGGQRFALSHFADCPFADQHRKRRK
jgi:hypothetical protein